MEESISAQHIGSRATPPSPHGSWAATLWRRKNPSYIWPPTHLSGLLQVPHSLLHVFFSAWSPATNSAMCSPANTISPRSYSDSCASGVQHSPCPGPDCKRSNTDPHLRCCVVYLVDNSLERPFNLPTVCCPIKRQELWQFIFILPGFLDCASSSGCCRSSPTEKKNKRGFF